MRTPVGFERFDPWWRPLSLIGGLSKEASFYADFGKGVYTESGQSKGFNDLFDFTRNGSATYWGADGKLHTAGPDVPRYEYDPVTGLFRGLLIEGTTATNLLDYSEDFSQWTASTAVSVTTVPVTAPDGTGTMTQLETTSDTLYRQNPIYTGSPTVGTTYVFSYFVKTDQYQFARLNGLGLGPDGVVFDLVNKTFNIFAGWDTAGIIDCGNNTVRVWAVGTASSTNGAYISFAESLNDVGVTPAGSKLHIWGAQLEEHQSIDGPSSYIPTNGASVTRAADDFRSKAHDWASYKQGTIYYEGDWWIKGGNKRLIGFVGSKFPLGAWPDRLFSNWRDDGGDPMKTNIPTTPGNGKIAVSWSVPDKRLAVYYNGQLEVEDTDWTKDDPSLVSGPLRLADGAAYSHIKDVIYLSPPAFDQAAKDWTTP